MGAASSFAKRPPAPYRELRQNEEKGKGLVKSLFPSMNEANNLHAIEQARTWSLTILKNEIFGVKLAIGKSKDPFTNTLYGWNGTHWCQFPMPDKEREGRLHGELNLYYGRQGTNIVIHNGTGYILPQ